MRYGEGVTEYFSRVMTVANKMQIYGENMQDVKVRRNGEKQALKVIFEGGRGRGRGTYRGRGRGRGRADFNKATVQCYWMPSTWTFSAKREDAWFLDSGCSNHMCNDQTMFNELDEKFRHSVKLGNNTKMDMMGKGSVKLLLDGVNHVVVEVYYIPELRNNLLSIGQLQERGLAILIKGGMCKIFHLEKVLSDKNSKLVSPLASEIWASELQGFENLVVQEHGVYHWQSKNVTPEEAWSGVKPSVESFLGLCEESKGYRLFDPIAKRFVVSRDIIFEEEKQWDWDGEERVRELRQSRDRQPPTWMGYYVSGEGLFKDEIHMTLVESTDPLYFEEAVKNANWRLAMNNEIKSIEKNQTWTLTELPTGAKKKKKKKE
ncbi:hypothetical protein CK203_039677 [Vitis vinifera]|uniref:Retrovirus-related Pol polyprotein from transposon TNT 1-94 n=1 Tax=Vitis vinifera TaxID=29760 RepID=A0A438HFM1_VITVI|nr:hypothetical protein CK203_039677 [Vitis vinifera]